MAKDILHIWVPQAAAHAALRVRDKWLRDEIRKGNVPSIPGPGQTILVNLSDAYRAKQKRVAARVRGGRSIEVSPAQVLENLQTLAVERREYHRMYSKTYVKQTPEALRKKAQGRARKVAYISALVIRAVENDYRLPTGTICGRGRNGLESEARFAALVALRSLGLRVGEIARVIGRDHGTISSGLKAAATQPDTLEEAADVEARVRKQLAQEGRRV